MWKDEKSMPIYSVQKLVEKMSDGFSSTLRYIIWMEFFGLSIINTSPIESKILCPLPSPLAPHRLNKRHPSRSSSQLLLVPQRTKKVNWWTSIRVCLCQCVELPFSWFTIDFTPSIFQLIFPEAFLNLDWKKFLFRDAFVNWILLALLQPPLEVIKEIIKHPGWIRRILLSSTSALFCLGINFSFILS